MDDGGQCLLISFQPENHFHAPERTGPTKFHDIILITEISSQFDVKTLGVSMHTIIHIWKLNNITEERSLLLETLPSKAA